MLACLIQEDTYQLCEVDFEISEHPKVIKQLNLSRKYPRICENLFLDWVVKIDIKVVRNHYWSLKVEIYISHWNGKMFFPHSLKIAWSDL